MGGTPADTHGSHPPPALGSSTASDRRAAWFGHHYGRIGPARLFLPHRAVLFIGALDHRHVVGCVAGKIRNGRTLSTIAAPKPFTARRSSGTRNAGSAGRCTLRRSRYSMIAW